MPSTPAVLVERTPFSSLSLPALRDAAGLGDAPWPPVWTADFIARDGATPASGFGGWALGEINAMAVGHTAFSSMEEFGARVAAGVVEALSSPGGPT